MQEEREVVGDNPDEGTPSAQPVATDTAGSQPTTTDSTATQPETTDSQPVEGTRITAYYDNNGNGKYDPDVDELIGTSDILMVQMDVMVQMELLVQMVVMVAELLSGAECPNS